MSVLLQVLRIVNFAAIKKQYWLTQKDIYVNCLSRKEGYKASVSNVFFQIFKFQGENNL